MRKNYQIVGSGTEVSVSQRLVSIESQVRANIGLHRFTFATLNGQARGRLGGIYQVGSTRDEQTLLVEPRTFHRAVDEVWGSRLNYLTKENALQHLGLEVVQLEGELGVYNSGWEQSMTLLLKATDPKRIDLLLGFTRMHDGKRLTEARWELMKRHAGGERHG